MAYTKKTWVTGETIQAVDLNHLESGVEAISANGAINTANIANSAVTNDKLDQDAVDSNNIRNGAIITLLIHDEAVTSAKIANNSITEDELSDGAVTADKIASSVSITNAQIDALFE